MRWDELFADLEAQADALERAERASEIDERARMEFSSITILDRLRAAVAAPVRLEVAGGASVSGLLSRVGVDWVLVDEGSAREAVVPLAAVRTVAGLGRVSAVPGSGGAVFARLTIRTALRGLARDRSAVRLHLVDATVLDATIDRVGADFVEVARHPAGEARRRSAVRDVVVVAVSALAVIRRQAI